MKHAKICMSELPILQASVSTSAGCAATRVTDDGDVRIGPVAAVLMVLTELGFNPRRAFVRAGVPLRTFKNPENRIAFEALGRLLSECACQTNCSHFGLLVGRHFDLKGLGAIGYTLLDAEIEWLKQIMACAIAIPTNILRCLFGLPWRPYQVLFAFSPPTRVGSYQRFFGVVPNFDADRTGIVFQLHLLRAPVPSADLLLH